MQGADGHREAEKLQRRAIDCSSEDAGDGGADGADPAEDLRLKGVPLELLDVAERPETYTWTHLRPYPASAMQETMAWRSEMASVGYRSNSWMLSREQ